MNTMQATFRIQGTRKRKGALTPIDRVIKARVDADGIHLRYGYYLINEDKVNEFIKKYHTLTVNPNNCYVTLSYEFPKAGDTITHIGTGRTFTVGKVDGFVCYEAPLVENGNENGAKIFFEEYYKE